MAYGGHDEAVNISVTLHPSDSLPDASSLHSLWGQLATMPVTSDIAVNATSILPQLLSPSTPVALPPPTPEFSGTKIAHQTYQGLFGVQDFPVFPSFFPSFPCWIPFSRILLVVPFLPGHPCPAESVNRPLAACLGCQTFLSSPQRQSCHLGVSLFPAFYLEKHLVFFFLFYL